MERKTTGKNTIQHLQQDHEGTFAKVSFGKEDTWDGNPVDACHGTKDA